MQPHDLENGGISKTTPGTHSLEGCVGPSANLNSLEEAETNFSLSRFESRFLGRLVHILITIPAELSQLQHGICSLRYLFSSWDCSQGDLRSARSRVNLN